VQLQQRAHDLAASGPSRHFRNAWEFAAKRTKGLETFHATVDAILADAQEKALAKRYGVDKDDVAF